VPGQGRVRVAVHAAGVSPVDAGNRADGSWAGLAVPFIPGYEVARVVESPGPGVSGVAIAAGRRAMHDQMRGSARPGASGGKIVLALA